MTAWGDRQVENATISYVKLGFHDGYGSIPTAYVGLTYDCGGQGFGGYHIGGEAAYTFIYGVLDALECEAWEKLVGKPCRVDHEHNKVHRIGHYLKDKWFDADTAMKALKEVPRG